MANRSGFLVSLSGAALVGAATAIVACGGGGGGGGGVARAPAVVSVRFVGTDGQPIAAVNPSFVPRNAWVEIAFEAPIDPTTAGEPFIRVRRGPHFAETSQGQFHQVGSRVYFDPTVLSNGLLRPYGFDASTEYEIRIPAGVPTGEMVRSPDGLPILTTYALKFQTTGGWIVESDPPRVVGHSISPGVRADGTIDAHAAIQIDFSEPIAPTGLGVGLAASAPAASDAFDVRFEAGDPVNLAGGVAGMPIAMRATLTNAARSVRLEPEFGYGDRKFALLVRALPGVRDLAGNPLASAVEVARYVSAGDGPPVPVLLGEGFDTKTDADPAPSRESAVRLADWSNGALTAQPITIRRAYVQAARRAIADNQAGAPGVFVVYPAPLTGRALAVAFPNYYPAPAAGRRVLLSFAPEEVGASGTVLGAAWGPNLNATFASYHAELVVRLGFGALPRIDLGATISASYEAAPIVAYRGPYTVAQRANVGNEAPVVVNSTGVAADQPLYDFTGFVEWPAFAKTIEWDDTRGLPLLLDVSATEGDTWQDFRGYFAGLAAGAPRRLAATFEGDVAVPAATPVAPNPDPSVMDTAFTIGRHRSIAQSRFYTPGLVDPVGHAYPAPYSAARTFGTRSDYGAAVVRGTLPPGVAVTIEYQGATALDAASGRTAPDLAAPATPWTTNPDDCDGYPYVRWRVLLAGDYATSAVPVLDSVVLPVRALP